MIKVICEYCGKTFQTYPSLRRGKGKFCSRECHHKSMIGQKPWNYAPRVEKICQYCGKHFTIPTWKAKQGGGKFCSPHCAGEATLAPYRGKTLSDESKEKLSRTIKHQMESSERLRACSEGMKGVWQDPQRRVRMVEKHSVALKKRWQDPVFRAKMSKIRKELWQNPEFRERMVSKIIAGLQKKPTKPERRLINIMNKNLPEFKYNGDFSLGITIGGLVPDFINVNGKKEVIELLGDYFHSPEVLGDRWQGSELGKIAIYNSVGYKCLVIWGSEVKTLTDDEVVNRVKSFFTQKRVRR